MNKLYSADYFASEIFSQNYALMAETIIAVYRPQTVIDVGCGPGHLSKALAACGVAVTALDGHAKPDVAGTTVKFHACDLNSRDALNGIAREIKGPFDLAVCLEV